MSAAPTIAGLILDLDGTVYHGESPVEGAPEFIRRLKREGVRYLFATNRANRAPETIAATLRGFGLDCSADQVVTAATATALYLQKSPPSPQGALQKSPPSPQGALQPKGTFFAVGEAALRQALTGAGFEETTGERADYVVVGLDQGLTYQKLNTAVRAILAGAKFVATNPDLLIKVGPDTFDIGNGSIVAAIAAATGAEPLVIGKPHPPLLEASLERLGLPRESVLVVGDNLETDVEGGRRAGIRTAAIFTGISKPSDVERLGIRPDYQVSGYDELAEIVFSRVGV
jgi:4-nitrophenyl phosphatase